MPDKRRNPSIATRTRAGIRAVKAEGESIRAVQIGPDGSVRIFVGSPITEEVSSQTNEWDEVLPRQS